MPVHAPGCQQGACTHATARPMPSQPPPAPQSHTPTHFASPNVLISPSITAFALGGSQPSLIAAVHSRSSTQPPLLQGRTAAAASEQTARKKISMVYIACVTCNTAAAAAVATAATHLHATGSSACRQQLSRRQVEAAALVCSSRQPQRGAGSCRSTQMCRHDHCADQCSMHMFTRHVWIPALVDGQLATDACVSAPLPDGLERC